MTLVKTKAGIFEGDFRAKGVERLHISMRTREWTEATERHAAVAKLFRQKRHELIAQLRAGELTVERITEMVEQNEPLVPVVVPVAPEPVVAEVVDLTPLWETVDDASADYLRWMADHPHKRERTTMLAGFQIKRFREFEYEGQRIGTMALDRVPSAAIQAYQRTMRADDVPVNTIITYMSRVTALWNWAIAQDVKDARDHQRAPRPLYSPVDSDLLLREMTRRDRVLTIPEAERLMAATPDALRFPVACGLLAGLRIGETLHLRPGLDVDCENGTITIRDQPDWKPKTRRARRLIPMADALKDYATFHAKRYASASWMIPSSASQSRPLTEWGWRLHFRPIVARAELLYGRHDSQGVVYHTLRHSFASHAIMRGVDLYTVAQLLGDSLKMVEDVYADLSPDHKRQAVRKLAAAFNLQGTTGE